MATQQKKEAWNSRLGVILAVAGSAVGLGNFLRFPGQAAQYGGGAFMFAYFISLLIIGIPICWAEWTMGRYGGRKGFNSCPGILGQLIKHPAGKYVGVLGVIIPVIIYMYYVYIEAWCLGYAVNFAVGNLNLGSDVSAYGDFFDGFVGAAADGVAVGVGMRQVGVYLLLVFLLNFFLINRGLTRGIEFFCKYAMPVLLFLAVLILVRVLTLGAPVPDKPDQTITNGLGYMWNPDKLVVQSRTVKPDAGSPPAKWKDDYDLVGEETIQAKRAEIGDGVRTTFPAAEGAANAAPTIVEYRIVERSIWDQLKNPQLWLAAAGQIFFSLSVGFGVIITYASYLSKKDDVVLSGLSATSANEFCEVALGGLISIPAAYVFLGAAGVAGQGTFGLGFNVLPLVFSAMPFGAFFGFLFFFLLFLAAVTSSLSMLQPGIAFLEEAIPMNRKQSVAVLGLITSLGCGFVVYASAGLKALDTIDFWVGTFLIFVLATIQVIVFGWVLGIEKGFKEAHLGAEMRIPNFFKFVIKYLSPAYLLVIFVLFILFNVFGWDPATNELNPTSYVVDLIGSEDQKPNNAARLSVALIGAIILFMMLIIAGAKERWIKMARSHREGESQ